MSDNSLSAKTRVCIVHPADPCGSIPGGIDTFIRGEIDNAPDDIEYSVIGVTTDADARPPGQWVECALTSNTFRFYGVYEHEVGVSRPLLPVIVQYLARLGRVVRNTTADVLEVHRFETLLRLRRETRPLTAVLHQNMQSLYDSQADILWAKLPAMYFWLEDRLAPRLDSAFCVRTDATEHYRSRYDNLADTCRFQPTWADPRHFRPASAAERVEQRQSLVTELGLDPDSRWLLSVGRLDSQKNPMLLLRAFQRLRASGSKDIQLLIVGEGQLRPRLEKFIAENDLSGSVFLLGLKSTGEVACLLHTADLFVLSSAYEGMPMAVIEALATGVPVATTEVGEVRRVVNDEDCGKIAASHSEEDLADAIGWCLEHLERISGRPCLASAAEYSPSAVLKPVYDNYRRLAAARLSASARRA